MKTELRKLQYPCRGMGQLPRTGQILIMMSPSGWVLKAARKLEHSLRRRKGEAASCPVRRLSDERRKSADGPISLEKKKQQTPYRQLSLRRHR